jgi:hypothetical protein
MITAIFTSCGRFNLLEKTMKSFFNYVDLPIEQTIVIENSADLNIEKHMEDISISINRPFDLIINEENIGQVSSIDRAYSFVNTEYIFHCEDDWEFFDTGFLFKSKMLLDDRPDIVNINLRVRFDGEKGSMHPITDIMTSTSGIRYHEYEKNYLNAWHGFSWNPGLRRKKEYELIGSFKQHGEESAAGKFYKDHGYTSACLEKSYCKHIGTNSITPKSNK